MNHTEPIHIENCETVNVFEFPFKTRLSFEPLIRFWQEKSKKNDRLEALIWQEIGEHLEKYPALSQPIDDFTLVQKHWDFVDILMASVFPVSLKEDEISAAFVPYTHQAIYSTPMFRNMILDESFQIRKDEEERMAINQLISACHRILEVFYGVKVSYKLHYVIQMNDEVTGLIKWANIQINPKFTELKLVGELPELSEDDIRKLLDNVADVELWMRMLPPENFEIHGVILLKIIDVTEEQIFSTLKYELLKKDSIVDSEKFGEIQHQIRSFLNQADINLGVAVYHPMRQNFIKASGGTCQSFMMEMDGNIDCREEFGEYLGEFQVKNSVTIKDTMKVKNPPNFIKRLQALNLRSILIIPLRYDNEFVGVLEIGSPTPHVFNSVTALELDEIVPLFAIAAKRSADEYSAKVQAVMKEEFTAIHSSVEWRFVQEAMNVLERHENDASVLAESITFKDVYPLYGATDVRGSSTERNKAIKEDLVAQLETAQQVLELVIQYADYPIADELLYRINLYINRLKNKLYSGDEVNIIDFLQNEVEETIRYVESHHLNKKHQDLVEIIQKYWNQLDEDLGILYRSRKNFEDSLTMINEVSASFIDEQEVRAQKMFPHYFEKYKTDGIEYNIYVGNSISEDNSYHPMQLKNLRIWQLKTMCELARKTHKLKNDLPIPLETTQLILVQSTPLAIQFRIDEKKFDVDGAYNIRYEIVKKRIDKALINGTQERLTQPHKIAIVYAQPKEALEYRKYLEYLKARNYILDEIEDVELEALQGVNGLQALRITVNYEPEKEKVNGKATRKQYYELETAV